MHKSNCHLCKIITTKQPQLSSYVYECHSRIDMVASYADLVNTFYAIDQ